MDQVGDDDVGEPIDKAERRRAIKVISVALGDVLKAHRKGEPIIARMAENILRREREATDALVRDALENPEKG